MPEGFSPAASHDSGPRILWAHDDEGLLTRGAAALGQGYRVSAFSDGGAALAAARQAPPDLIVCAAALRGPDGAPLWRVLRGDAAFAGAPVILTVGGGDDEIPDTAADDVLYEPFTERELLARVRVNLRQANERRAGAAREAALKADTEAMLRRIELVMSHLPFGLTMVNPDHQIVYSNPARERLLHFAGQPKIGEHLAERLPALRADGTPLLPEEYPIRRALKGELVTDLEIQYDSGDGAPHWLRTSGIPVPGPDGTVQYAIGVAIDITGEVRNRLDLLKLTESLEERVRGEIDERLKAEETLRQVQKMQVIGELTGGVAHDFNNLLQVMHGNLEAIERQLRAEAPLDRTRLSRQATAALRGAERARQMTQQLLAFSRRQPLKPAPLDVNDLVRRMAELFRRTLGESIVVTTKLEPALKLAYVDQNQLEAALLNLAVNARDAMPGGGRLVIATDNRGFAESRAAPWEEFVPGDYVAIAVSDTGSGIAPEVMAHIFEPFFTTKEVGRGTGLGLSQAYGFAKQSGGHLLAESKLGAGATMTLFLPVRSAPEVSIRSDEPAPARRGSQGEIVLVVEDDPDVRGFSVETLQELGYGVVEAGSAAEALRQLDKEPGIRLMFTDVGLPGGVSGRQLADEARARHPGLKVLFTTGYARDSILQRGRLEPGVDLIAKPFTASTLAARIRDLLETA